MNQRRLSLQIQHTPSDAPLRMAFLLVVLIASFLLETQAATALESTKVLNAIIPNLPASFYNRDGLDTMPHINYEALPVVNVLDCGANGDGVNDNCAAFQKALDVVCSKGGGIIYIPKGVYLFTAGTYSGLGIWDIKKTLKNVHFVGDGEESIIRYEGNNTKHPYCWNFVDCENSSIRNLSFSCFPFINCRGHNRGIYPIQFGDYTPGKQRAYYCK